MAKKKKKSRISTKLCSLKIQKHSAQRQAKKRLKIEERNKFRLFDKIEQNKEKRLRHLDHLRSCLNKAMKKAIAAEAKRIAEGNL